jgi:hypothetical protein
VLGGCGGSSQPADESKPATVQKVGGQERITLTSQASQRVGIRTAVARIENRFTVVPYSAIEYEANGTPYTYVQLSPLVFSRRNVIVDHIDGSKAFLSSGLTPGTAVVDVGADELRGTEVGVEEEG